MTGFDILMIGPFPSDEARIEGGIQASTLGLCRALIARPDVRGVRVVAPPHHAGVGVEHRTVAGIEATFLDTPLRLRVSSVLRLPLVLGMLGRADERIVHLHGSGVLELAVTLACRLGRIPMVWTLHGLTEKETLEEWRRRPSISKWLRHLLYTFCERAQLRLSRSLIVDTPYVAREVEGRSEARPAAIPQGIVTAEFAEARARTDREPLILSLGVIHPRKGHDRTIAAFAEIADRFPEARLMVMGSLTSPEHLDELKALAGDLGVAGRVNFRIGTTRAEILDALGRATLFALHTQEESQGIALCEAMSAGLPIVATRVGGIPDVIGSSAAGVLVDYGDVPGFAAAIARLLDDPEERARMAAAGVARAGAFEWSAVAAGVVARYRLAQAGADDRGRRPTFPETPVA